MKIAIGMVFTCSASCLFRGYRYRVFIYILRHSTGRPAKLNKHPASSPKIRAVLSIRCLATTVIPHAPRGRAVLSCECSVSRHTPS